MCGDLRRAPSHFALLFALQAALCGNGVAADSTFPPVKVGVWEVTAVRTLPDGQTQSWKRKASHCQNTSPLFQGYWGLGIVDLAGCRIESTKVSANRYKIASECMVRGAEKAVSNATVTLTGDSVFEMDVKVLEGRRYYHATESGQRVGDCTR